MPRKRTYPVVIIFKEKHGDRHFLANNEDEFYGAFRVMFLGWYTSGFHFDDNDIEPYRSDLERLETEGERAFYLLNMLSDYEYQGFEIVEPEVIKEDQFEDIGL